MKKVLIFVSLFVLFFTTWSPVGAAGLDGYDIEFNNQKRSLYDWEVKEI